MIIDLEKQNNIDREWPYSLIIDSENLEDIKATTRSLNLGDIINWLGKEYICIGSGEIFGEKDYNLQEIRANLVERMNIDELRKIFGKLVRKNEIPKLSNDAIWIGRINTIYRPEDEEIDVPSVIFYLKISDGINSINIPARFTELNKKYIYGLDFEKPRTIINKNMYIFGYVEGKKEIEIIGRAILPIE